MFSHENGAPARTDLVLDNKYNTRPIEVDGTHPLEIMSTHLTSLMLCDVAYAEWTHFGRHVRRRRACELASAYNMPAPVQDAQSRTSTMTRIQTGQARSVYSTNHDEN